MKNKELNILIADDDRYFRLAISKISEKFGHVTQVSNLQDASNHLKNYHYDLALLDMQMDHPFAGIELLKITKKQGINSIILSSYDADETTDLAYELGCAHYLNKINYREYLEHAIETVLANKDDKQIQNILSEYHTQDSNLIEKIKILKNTNLKNQTIFISGETGVGKTAFAKILHKIIYKEEAPFIHLNCSEINENLLESELFGSVKGAFTGAHENKKGKLEMAHNGVLFLDEIGTMSISMQQKLLKAIEEKTFYPVGSERLIKSEFTLITATCEDLFTMISRGLFRKDLFFRLSAINIEIPPLRDRAEDIILILKHVLKNSPRKIILKEDALDYLKKYTWPGNIRELRQVATHLLLNPSGIIYLGDIKKIINHKSIFVDDNETNQNELSLADKNYIWKHGLRGYVARVEKQMVTESLKRNNGKISLAIKDLQISSSAFYRILGQ